MRTRAIRSLAGRSTSWLMLAAFAMPMAGLGATRVLSWLPSPSVPGSRPPAARTTTGAMPLPATTEVATSEAEARSGQATRGSAAASGVAGPDEIRWFNGRPIRPARTITMRVTAYSPDERSCGRFADGVTASGYSVWTNGMKLVAADTKLLPFGTLISIPGYHEDNPVPVLDRGGRIKGHRLDVLYPTHERARQWGVQTLDVVVWEYADGRPPDFRSRPRR